MTEFVHLVGAEEVSRAACTIQGAAEQISRSVGHLEDVLHRNRNAMQEMLAEYRDMQESKINTILDNLISELEGNGSMVWNNELLAEAIRRSIQQLKI